MSVLWPKYGTLDSTHRAAIEAAYHHHWREHGDLMGLGLYLAVYYGKNFGVEHAGVFAMAFSSTVDALDIELRDRVLDKPAR